MLLKHNNNYIKDFFLDFVFKNKVFFVMNINDYEIFEFYNYCLNFSKIFHKKSFLGFNIFSNLFSGNNYFCFLEPYYFFDYYLELINNNLYDLIGICFNNFFFNINFNFFNLSNKIYFINFLILYYYYISYLIFLFFIFLNFLKNLNFKLIKVLNC